MRSQCVRMVFQMRSHWLLPLAYGLRGSLGNEVATHVGHKGEGADLGRRPDLICEQRERLLQGRRVDGATIPRVLVCNPRKQLCPHAAKLFRPGVGNYRCAKSVLERFQVAAMSLQGRLAGFEALQYLGGCF